MTRIRDKYPGLSALFGFALYDNENWEKEFGTTQKTVRAYLSDPENNYSQRLLKLLIEDIDECLAANPDEKQIASVLETLCSGYYYPTRLRCSGREWLLSIRAEMEDVLKQAKKENRF